MDFKDKLEDIKDKYEQMRKDIQSANKKLEQLKGQIILLQEIINNDEEE